MRAGRLPKPDSPIRAGIPAHLNEQLRSSTPFQFAVSANLHGRIHGFFVDHVFFVVWLDPDHCLYPGRK
ncbi:hypothetical protein ACIPO9_04375 [Pseudomonas sp. NPDC090203]|jgi:hypothetical protein|uniref:hypothetical protein n=1 Tax=Pseudomonas TaxID=286 RepID=UPI00236419FC|nr:hypothetical protein [Pseudomonas putida]MDD1966378.1 hypothetical protein [Pseudomonas putida]